MHEVQQDKSKRTSNKVEGVGIFGNKQESYAKDSQSLPDPLETVSANKHYWRYL
jgi:hypothetical protein